VEPRLPLDFLADFARALDHDNALKSGPLMAFLQPGHIMDCGVGSRLDATMIAIDGLMLTDLGILKAVGFLLGDENLNILAKGALVALEREDVVGLLFQDFLSDIALTAHGIDRHNGTLNGQHFPAPSTASDR